MKKLAFFSLMFVFFITNILSCDALSVSAKYACVIDAQSGRVLFEKNAYTKHSMASTTKIMTALLALKYANPTDMVTVSKNAEGTEGSSIYLKSAEQISLHDLLYGLMLASGNDAAVAIAEHVSGDVASFAKLMTEEAHLIGATNSSFKNPNGLDDEGHYTTAYDLALITRAALKIPEFCTIVSTKSKKLTQSDVGYERYVTNHNKMLRLYSGCIGVKTGYTKKTGRCLVTAAERDNLRIIAVTLSAPDDWNDHTRMLDYSFSQNCAVPVVKKNMAVCEVPIISGDRDKIKLYPAEDYYLSAPIGTSPPDISISLNAPEKLPAPVNANDPIGSLSVSYKGELIKQIELIAEKNVYYLKPPKPRFWEVFIKLFVPTEEKPVWQK